MAENTKTRSQLIAQYPDNATQEISAEDLRDFVVSVDIYAEIYASSDLSQGISGGSGEDLVYNANGLSAFCTPDEANNQIIIDHDGNYEVRFEGSANIETSLWIDHYVRVNGVNVRKLGRMEQKESDQTTPSYAFGGIFALAQGDLVTHRLLRQSGTVDFDIREGARMVVKRLMAE